MTSTRLTRRLTATRRARRSTAAAFGLAMTVGLATVMSVPAAAAARPPSTRDGVAGLLVQNGFSSVVRLQHTDAAWIGEGVRNGALLDFTVDRAGHLETRPSAPPGPKQSMPSQG